MRRTKPIVGVLVSVVIGATVAGAMPPSSRTPVYEPIAATAGPLIPTEAVRPEFRDAVRKVTSNPTIATKASGEKVICTIAVYEWLYDHPDRVALAWQRLQVPSITITDMGGGKFAWVDENGSEVVWQTVGKVADGRVWYANGKVKAARAMPSIPVQAVVLVAHPKKVEKDGVALFVPTAHAYMHCDSRTATLALRALGPTAPKLAEDAAGQLLDFFGGIANYVQKNPKQAEELLGSKR